MPLFEVHLDVISKEYLRMFKSLVKSIFSSDNNSPNYLYFEESKDSAEEEQKKAVTELQKSLNSKSIDLASIEEKHQIEFYNFLFGQSPPTAQHDELSLFITEQIEVVMNNPKQVLDSLPLLPTSLSKILEQLNNEECDIDELLRLIHRLDLKK